MSNDFITTYTGKKFYPLNPQPDQICIRDIAMGLSKTCRFSGQLSCAYTVAEHSVLVSRIVENSPDTWLLPPQSLDVIRSALLHDAAEAYIADVPTPLKKDLPLYIETENRILEVIFEKFKIDAPHLFSGNDPLKIADIIALKTEFRDLTPHGYMQYPKYPMYNTKILPVRTSEEARAIFLNRFVELFFERGEQ